MQEIKGYIIAATLIYLYVDNMSSILLRVDGLSFKPRNKFTGYLFNHKPFNCGTCLSFWTGILLTIITFNILFITLPLSYKLLKRYL